MYKDFSEPSLANGIALLRDKTKWPDGFTWDYTDSCKCAIGLFCETWAKDQLHDSATVGKMIGIDRDNAQRIFNNAGGISGVHFTDVTPEFIADRLEELV